MQLTHVCGHEALVSLYTSEVKTCPGSDIALNSFCNTGQLLQKALKWHTMAKQCCCFTVFNHQCNKYGAFLEALEAIMSSWAPAFCLELKPAPLVV